MLNEHIRPTPWQLSWQLIAPRPLWLTRLGRAVYPIAKRSLDLLLALGALIFFAPLMLAIAAAIRLDSPGPAIYVQRRCGLGGRAFSFYKFRSMTNGHDHTQEHRKFAAAYINGQVVEAQSDGNGEQVYKPASNGHSVTRVGRWLRSTSLDELPQLFNIAKGDMTLVGPRPSIDYEVEMYTDWHRLRLAVLPGLTGWAQINGRSRLGFDEIVRLDQQYIAQRSIAMDLRILLATVGKVLRAEDVG